MEQTSGASSIRWSTIGLLGIVCVLGQAPAWAAPRRFTGDLIGQQKAKLIEAREQRRMHRQELQADRAARKAFKAELQADRHAVQAARQDVRSANAALRRGVNRGASAEDIAALAQQRDAAKATKAQAIGERRNGRAALQGNAKGIHQDRQTVRQDTHSVRGEAMTLRYQRQHRGFTKEDILAQGAELRGAREKRTADRTELTTDRRARHAITAGLQADRKTVNAAGANLRTATQALRRGVNRGASAEKITALAQQRDAAKATKAQAVHERRNDHAALQGKTKETHQDRQVVRQDTGTVLKERHQYHRQLNHYVNGGRQGFIRDVTSSAGSGSGG